MRLVMVSRDEDLIWSDRTPLARSLSLTVSDVASEVASRGHEVFFLDPVDDPIAEVGRRGLRLVGATESPRSGGAMSAALASIGRADPHLIHAFGTSAARTAMQLSSRTGVPWVWSPWHDPLPERAEVAALSTTACRVVAATPGQADDLVAAGAPSHRVDVVPLAAAVLPEVASNPPVSPGLRLVVTVADEEGSGVADVIRAVSRLPLTHVRVLADPAIAEREDLRRRWSALARSLHVGDRIRVAVERSPSAARSWMESADAVVYVPHRDLALPVASAALASGAPLVVSALSGVEAIVEQGVTGTIVRPGDARRLSSVLHLLDRTAESRAAMSFAARRRAREMFDEAVLVEGLFEAYAAAGAPLRGVS